MDSDSTYEDVDAVWADVNNDSFNDLVVASGGNEYYGNSDFLLPRVYLNDGKGNLQTLKNAFDREYNVNSIMLLFLMILLVMDYIDLFIGGRAVPWEYGTIPQVLFIKK